MTPSEAIDLADRMALRTGETYVVVHVAGEYQAWPYLDALGMPLLEIVRP